MQVFPAFLLVCQPRLRTSSLQGLTKYVPRPGLMDRPDVSDIRKGNWTCFWLFSAIICILIPPCSSGELAFTNFDTQRLEEITSKGIHISSNQVKLPSSSQSSVPPLLPLTVFETVCPGPVLSDRPESCSQDAAVLFGQPH
uniref:Uncharacterized protein n=1 Tax=Amphiprion ocellaris TaxID=80972 RepID=A0AAQ5YJC1_AMPOC